MRGRMRELANLLAQVSGEGLAAYASTLRYRAVDFGVSGRPSPLDRL